MTLHLSPPHSLLPQVLQSSDLPAGLVNILTGRRDQMTVALANHSVIKAIWYWGSAEVRVKNQLWCSLLVGLVGVCETIQFDFSDLLFQGCQYLQRTCANPLKTLYLSRQMDEEKMDEGMDWTRSSVLEEMWRNAVQWKSVWIPTA